MKELFKDNGFKRLLFLFILVSGLTLVFRQFFEDRKIDTMVVFIGNILIFASSVLALLLYGRAKSSKTPHGFSRNVYAAFVTKFFVLVTAAMLYFYFAQDDISTRAVFICLGLYFVYHFAGAAYAARIEKKKVKHH